MYVFHGRGMVWDGEANRPLARFEGGRFSTTDERIAQKLVQAGYRLEKRPIQQREPQTLDKMNLAELKEYAAEHGIDLAGATKKSDILARITSSEKEVFPQEDVQDASE